MKRIETKADALEAASAALDLIRAIRSSGINFGDAIDISLASALADLGFVYKSLGPESAADMAIRLAKEHRFAEKSK